MFHRHSPLSRFSTLLSNESSRLGWSARIECRSWKNLVRTVSGFSCFAIERQFKCLHCVFLGAFTVSALSLILVRFFSLQRSPFCPDCETKSVELCSLKVLSFSLLMQQKSFELQFCPRHHLGLRQFVRLCCLQEQGRQHKSSNLSPSLVAALCAMYRLVSTSQIHSRFRRVSQSRSQ